MMNVDSIQELFKCLNPFMMIPNKWNINKNHPITLKVFKIGQLWKTHALYPWNNINNTKEVCCAVTSKWSKCKMIKLNSK